MKGALIFAGAFLAFLITPGCGSEEALSDGGPAEEALIIREDLPGKVTLEEGLPPEPCGPVKIFEDEGGKAAESEMLRFQGIRTQQAVGFFPKISQAEAAYATLVGDPNIECIAEAIASSRESSDRVEVFPLQALEVGTVSAMFRIRITGPDSKEQVSVAVARIRSGRCVSALVILTTTSAQLRRGIRELVPKAEQGLGGVC